jgi:hypothetical protein
MSWEQFLFRPPWKYTAKDDLLDVGIVIIFMAVRYYLYKFNIIESRYKKGLREFKERNEIFLEELKHYLDKPAEERKFENFEARANKRIQALESKKS